MIGLGFSAQGAEKNTRGLEFFETKIRPVLANQCYECHSAKSTKIKGGLLLDTRAGLREGGDSGTVIVPGKPDESLLIKSLRHEGDIKMPPKNRLPDSVVQDFVQWVSMGAPDPREGQAASKGYKTMTLAEAKTFWAYQQPKKSAPPVTNNTSWAKSTIDQFLLAKMEEKGVTPVADAERTTLLRRLNFDVIGLPPTPAEIEAFVNDPAPDAVAKVVDRLLASRHFGERWGRHWLDIARYAESNGNVDNVVFPKAYLYRDYVIAAYNQDKPYDRFIMEQIAGDLLEAKDAKEKDQNIIATGLLALTSKPRAQSNPDYKYDLIADQIDVTTRSVLAMSVMCARCHDHKFDAIATKEYYAMAGIFDSTVMLYGNESGLGVGAKGVKANGFASLSDGSVAMGVREGKAIDCSVCVRGEAKNFGEKVQRGYLAVLTNSLTPKFNRNQSGRLELARAMTATDNPLTARVAVNRIWQHLFGQGIVRSPDNFGSLGDRPTHPELLDYLAVRFMENGWSTKQMIKEIVLSRAYQLASAYHEGNFKADPESMYWWRMPVRRLEAEAIRDSLLAVSGKLDPQPLQGTLLKLTNAKRVGNNPVVSSNHRSVYLPIPRGAALSEILALFDIASPNLVVAQREVTTVPAQALFMMNSPFVIEQAKSFAERVQAVKEMDDKGRVNLAYRIALGRDATENEKQRALLYLREAAPASSAQAWAGLCQTLFASAEFRYLQ
jgi:hypothetical protein